MDKRSQDPKDYVKVEAKDVHPDICYFRLSEDGKSFDRFTIASSELQDPARRLELKRLTSMYAKQGRIFSLR